MNRLMLSLSVILLLGSCTLAENLTFSKFKEVERKNSNDAVLYIYYWCESLTEVKYPGPLPFHSINMTGIHLNGDHIATLGWATYYGASLAPGTYTVDWSKSIWDNSPHVQLRILLEPGKTHYVRILQEPESTNYYFRSPKLIVKMDEVPSEYGEKIIKACSIGKTNIHDNVDVL